MLKCPSLPIRLCELMKKEVVNVYDGCRLGYICDLEMDTLCGRINVVYIPKCRISLKKKQYIVIKWEQIERIGADTVLVRLCKPDDGRGGDKG